jgi:phenylalanine-4-hydroxylase
MATTHRKLVSAAGLTLGGRLSGKTMRQNKVFGSHRLPRRFNRTIEIGLLKDSNDVSIYGAM